MRIAYKENPILSQRTHVAIEQKKKRNTSNRQ